MKKIEPYNKALFKERMQGKPKPFIDKLTTSQRQCVCRYSNAVKLNAVIRWKTRMAKASIRGKEMSYVLKVPEQRISEWLNLKHEPAESTFDAFEKILYNKGV